MEVVKNVTQPRLAAASCDCGWRLSSQNQRLYSKMSEESTKPKVTLSRDLSNLITSFNNLPNIYFLHIVCITSYLRFLWKKLLQLGITIKKIVTKLPCIPHGDFEYSPDDKLNPGFSTFLLRVI